MKCFRWSGTQSLSTDPGLEKQALKDRAEALRAELDAVEKCLSKTGEDS